jgi:ankyrin repeat protein
VYRYLIETKGCDVNVQTKDNDTPLYYAFNFFNSNEGGDISVLQYLLNQTNINVNTKGQCSYTLLHAACDTINNLPLDVFKLLIETKGFDVNAQDNCNDTPLHRAFRYFGPNDDSTVLMYLLTQTNVNVNIKGYIGDTLLHIACNNINTLPLEIFRLLIETMGCDVNVQDDDNNTPIQNALCCFDPDYGGDIKALAYLINQNNVNLNIKNEKGFTFLHLACICEIGEDGDDYDYDYEDSSDEGLEDSVIQNQKADTNLCQIVEIIAERCVQQVLDENNLE